MTSVETLLSRSIDFRASSSFFAFSILSELDFELSLLSSSDLRSKFFCSVFVDCCVIFFVTEGSGEGLKFKANTVVPLGCSTTGTTL